MMKPYLKTALGGYGSGFHFSAPPPPDMQDQRYLRSDDTSEVLGCILANFQRGVFDVADALLPLMKRAPYAGEWDAARHLLGYGAPMRHVREAFDWVIGQTDDADTYYASSYASSAGGLWCVRPTMERWKDTSDPNFRVLILSNLGWLLEGEPDKVGDGPDSLPVDEDSHFLSEVIAEAKDEAFRRIVSEREAALRAEGFDDGSVVAEGESLNLENVIRRLLDRLAGRASTTRGRIGHAIDLFEAMTGVSCATFYTPEGVLQPLSATAVLEDYLATGAAATFVPGVRYFFGHRIPT